MKLYRALGKDGEQHCEILVLGSDSIDALKSVQGYLKKIGRPELIPSFNQMQLGVKLPESGVINSEVRSKP